MMLDILDNIEMPDSVRASEVHVAVPAATWAVLKAGLAADPPNEACVFVFTRPSIGIHRTTILLGEMVWPRKGEVVATPYALEISADYISRALDAAIEAGPAVGLCLVHTHPKSKHGEGVGRFSPRDNWYEKRLFPTLVQGRSSAVFGSLVLGSAGDLDARIWWAQEGAAVTQPAECLRVIGPEITLIETPHSGWTDHPDPSVMDRSTRLWGVEGRRRLQNLRVGIVGAGGTGSVAVMALATMGVGQLLIWDRDVATKENRHRTMGITERWVGMPKVQAAKALAQSVATAEPFDAEVHEDWATSAKGLVALKDCDVIFCCVDKLAARVPLNDLAYAHLIPVIDMASWMHPDTDDRIDALVTHAHVLSPGIPCAWCRQTLTSYALMREAQGQQQGVEQRAPYGLTLKQTDGVEPSVLPLNLLGVSLALMEFMQVALGITSRTPNDLKFFLPEWELDESDLPARKGCSCLTDVGLGDQVRIDPVVMS